MHAQPPSDPGLCTVVSHQSGYTQLYPSDFFHSNYCSRLSLSVFLTVTILKPTYSPAQILKLVFVIRTALGLNVRNVGLNVQLFVYLWKFSQNTCNNRRWFSKTSERFPWLRFVHHIIVEEALLRWESLACSVGTDVRGSDTFLIKAVIMEGGWSGSRWTEVRAR